MPKLTVAGVRNAKPGRHADGDGLYLLVKPTGARSWLRVQVDGVRRDIGLGSVDLSPKVERDRVIEDIPILERRILSLAEARDKCTVLRKAALAGRDPVAERDKERRRVPTFKEVARSCHEDLKGSWSQRQADSFLASLEKHAFPTLGAMRVDKIEAGHIRDMLAPIWTDLTDMSRKVRGRVTTVLNYAHSKGWRPSEAPGKSVTMGLARKVETGNYAAMPYDEVPAFVADLRAREMTLGRAALLFTILTAARSGEVRKARWSQIDLSRKLWSRPASIMKSGTAHVVTLSAGALAVLEHAQAVHTSKEPDTLIFPSRKGAPLSDMTLTKVLRDANVPYTVHGFRSSFRDWVAEKMPDVPDAVAEAALAHVVPDKVVRAYKRTDFLEMRRELMEAWANFTALKARASLLRTRIKPTSMRGRQNLPRS